MTHKQTESNQDFVCFFFCPQRAWADIGFYGSDAHHGLDREEGSLAALRYGAGEKESFFVKRKAPIVVGAFVERCVVGDHHFVIVQEWLVVDVPASLSFAILFEKLKETLDERYRGRYVLTKDSRVFTYDTLQPCDSSVSFMLAHVVSGMSFIVY